MEVKRELPLDHNGNPLNKYERSKLDREEKRAIKKRRMAREKKKPVGDGGTEEVLGLDIANMLARVDGANETPGDRPPKNLPETQTVLELSVHELSSTGDGLAYSPEKDHVYVVPFAIPGDVVKAKVYKHFDTHSLTDFVEVVKPAPNRDDSLIGCKYFGKCGGCSYQMMPYEDQLLHKRRVIEKAYENFSGLEPARVPEIGPTWGSPLQYNYRTKLTPHFDGPRKGGFPADYPTPDIGFQHKGSRRVLDIEDCPIGTPAIREGLKTQREFVKNNLQTHFKRGATILLRESTTRTPAENSSDADGLSDYVEKKLCISDPKAVITEYFGKFKFESPAGTFFQNNNSILDGVSLLMGSDLV